VVYRDVGPSVAPVSIRGFVPKLGSLVHVSTVSLSRKGLTLNGAHRGISDAEKPHLRNRLLDLIREENNQVYFIACYLFGFSCAWLAFPLAGLE